jgi:pyrimidine operon attenuation protein/uracil phosphoribosyltransferase
MTQTDPPKRQDETVVMDREAMAAAMERMAREVVESNRDISSMALLGVLRRGLPLADRMAALIEKSTGIRPRVGALGITLYRDDLRAGVVRKNIGGGETNFDFTLDGVNVVLVDDVLWTGRTVRAALDEMMDYGRPRRVQLACLVDRGLRELPIQPDYCGRKLETKPDDHVAVRLVESDGEDAVVLIRTAADAGEGGR